MSILPSSPQSFHSAKTIGSSPVQTPSPRTPTPLYRQIRLLPYELREYIQIYFEEGLCKHRTGAFARILLIYISRLSGSDLPENHPNIGDNFRRCPTGNTTTLATPCIHSYASNPSYFDHASKECRAYRSRKSCSPIPAIGGTACTPRD